MTTLSNTNTNFTTCFIEVEDIKDETSSLISSDPLQDVHQIADSTDSDNKNSGDFDFNHRLSKIDKNKPFYCVKNGKIIKVNASPSLFIESKKRKKPKQSDLSCNENDILIPKNVSSDFNKNMKIDGDTSAYKKKPNSLERLMAKIDAQLEAQGIPVPENPSADSTKNFSSNIHIKSVPDSPDENCDNNKLMDHMDDDDFSWPLTDHTNSKKIVSNNYIEVKNNFGGASTNQNIKNTDNVDLFDSLLKNCNYTSKNTKNQHKEYNLHQNSFTEFDSKFTPINDYKSHNLNNNIRLKKSKPKDKYFQNKSNLKHKKISTKNNTDKRKSYETFLKNHRTLMKTKFKYLNNIRPVYIFNGFNIILFYLKKKSPNNFKHKTRLIRYNDINLKNITFKFVKRIHRCKYCNQKFDSKNKISLHLKVCHFNAYKCKSIQCVLCFKAFPNYALLNIHKKIKHLTHNNVNGTISDLISPSKLLKNSCVKNKDVYYVTQQNQFLCKLCKSYFNDIIMFFQHIYTLHNIVISTKDRLKTKYRFDFKKPIKKEYNKPVKNNDSALGLDPILSDDINIKMERLHRDPDRYIYNRTTISFQNGETLDLYKCDKCSKKFAMKKNLADHIRRVHLKSNINNPDYTYVCKSCKKAYKRSNDLKRHITLYHNDDESREFIKKENIQSNECFNVQSSNDSICLKNDVTCEVCGAHFQTNEELYSHKNVEHSLKTAILKNSHSSNKHIIQNIFENEIYNVNGFFSCNICSENLLSLSSFKKHFKSDHPNEEVNVDSQYPYSCQRCRKVFVKTRDLLIHAKETHNKLIKLPPLENQLTEYICDVCSKQFKYKQSLQRHIESKHFIYSDKLPAFQCTSGCSKRFLSKSNLERHTTIYDHFRCPTCQKHFSNKIMLAKHQIVHTNFRQYICSVCPKTYMHRHHLMQHELIHGERSHLCPHCPTACFTGSQLNSHMKVHSSEKPFKCKYCSESFKRNQGLREHERLHIIT